MEAAEVRRLVLLLGLLLLLPSAGVPLVEESDALVGLRLRSDAQADDLALLALLLLLGGRALAAQAFGVRLRVRGELLVGHLAVEVAGALPIEPHRHTERGAGR